MLRFEGYEGDVNRRPSPVPRFRKAVPKDRRASDKRIDLVRLETGAWIVSAVKRPWGNFARLVPEVLVLYRKRSGEGIFGEREKHERRSVFDTAT